MRERLTLMLRSALYAMRGGFLVRPLLIALVFGAWRAPGRPLADAGAGRAMRPLLIGAN